MALKPNIPNKQPGKVRITPRTAADYIIRTFALESKGDAVKFIQDPNGSIHFLIPTAILTRQEIESKLIPYFSNKIVMGGRCRIESIGMDWVAIHIEPIPTQQKGGRK